MNRQINRLYANDSYFLGDVLLNITPVKELGYTSVIAKVKSDSITYDWHVTINFYCTDIDSIFNEIKKDQYINQGYSEAY